MPTLFYGVLETGSRASRMLAATALLGQAFVLFLPVIRASPLREDIAQLGIASIGKFLFFLTSFTLTS